MFYYIKIRKKGKLNWKAARKEGKILVFNRYETAKRYTNSLNDYVCTLAPLIYHPSHKKSAIYGKKYIKFE